VQPECGDDAKEHSESCEDGNLDSGDGCDSLCRKELPSGDLEVEPNDEPRANANVLPLETGSAQVSGVIGGKCDFDSFAVAVPENGILSATIGGDCSYDLSLQLIRPNGFTEIETILTDAGECPAIMGANGLAEGVYFLRLTTQSEAEPTALDYSLEVQVTTP
jgi:cysteine-rich repeat protein